MKKNFLFLLIAVVSGMFGLSIMAGSAIADVPPMMSYQGKLTDATGTPVPDGTYCIEFKIYDSASGGSSCWTEQHSNVPVFNGLFSVILGSFNPIPDTCFNQPDRWLSVNICGEPEMYPRRRITSAGYAFNAGSLNGLQFLDHYDSGWFPISAGGCETKSHNLNLNVASDVYLIFVYGRNTTNYNVHQAHYGTEYVDIIERWWGCEWDELTSNTIRVCRGANDEGANEEKQWDQARVIIIIIKLP